MTFASNISDSRRRAEVFLARQDMKLGRWQEKSLRRRNRKSKAPVIGNEPVHVSMTTYGKRIETVHIAIESIAAVPSLPARFFLWLDDPELFVNLPDSLRRLQDRGLDIRLTRNYGPHTKYYPCLLAQDTIDLPLVIADDDVIYSRWWFAGLIQAWRQNQRVVSCYRAHVVPVENGVIRPYRTWGPCTSTVPDSRHFATGVSGCIYPPALLQKVKAQGEAFLHSCPKADDIWLHANALRHGFRVRQILSRQLNFPGVSGTQEIALFRTNIVNGNDEQIRATYTAEDIARMAPPSAPSAAAGAHVPECLS